MFFPDEQTLKQLRTDFPVGTRVVLERMDDIQAPAPGTIGVVQGVDDAGSLLMNWSNGSALNVVYGVDLVHKI